MKPFMGVEQWAIGIRHYNCVDAFRCIIKLRAVLHSHVERVEIGLEKHCKLVGLFSVFYLAQHGILRKIVIKIRIQKLWEKVETAKNRETFNKPRISNFDVKMYIQPLLFAAHFYLSQHYCSTNNSWFFFSLEKCIEYSICVCRKTIGQNFNNSVAAWKSRKKGIKLTKICHWKHFQYW